MTNTLHSPCTIGDLVEVVEHATHAQMAMYRVQLGAGMSFAGRNGLGVAFVVGGFVPLDDGTVEAWFAVNPNVGASGMVAVIRTITLTLRQSGYFEVHTRAVTPAGLRIARAAGFKPVNPEGDDHGRQSDGITWRWQRQGGRAGAG
jgi:hypothetical protein